MKLNKNLIIITLALLVVALLLFFLKDKICSGEKSVYSYVERKDTVYRTTPAKPIVINKVKTKLIKTSDTVVCTEPFVASIDTVILHDTVRAEFEYPANLISLSVRRHPDTLRTETIFLSSPIVSKEEWWLKPLIFAGGLGSGLLLGLIK